MSFKYKKYRKRGNKARRLGTLRRGVKLLQLTYSFDSEIELRTHVDSNILEKIYTDARLPLEVCHSGLCVYYHMYEWPDVFKMWHTLYLKKGEL